MLLELAATLAQLPTAAPPAPAAPRASLELEATIELPGVEGRIDHLALDAARGHLFVAALENGTLEVLDLKAGARLKSFGGLKAPQGLVYAREHDRIAVACGGSGRLELFDAEKLAPAGSVVLGGEPDNVRWDAARDRVVVATGEGQLVFVDAGTWKVTRTIECGAAPEAFQLDAGGTRALVNLAGAHAVAVVDLDAGRVLARIPIEGARRNYPMWWDAGAHLVAIGCREPARLVFVDDEKRAVAAVLELAGDVDDLCFDAKRGRIYAACGAGVLDVFEKDPAKSGAGAWHALARIPTAPGARTALFAPGEDRLYLAAPARGGSKAAVRIYFVP